MWLTRIRIQQTVSCATSVCCTFHSRGICDVVVVGAKKETCFCFLVQQRSIGASLYLEAVPLIRHKLASKRFLELDSSFDKVNFKDEYKRGFWLRFSVCFLLTLTSVHVWVRPCVKCRLVRFENSMVSGKVLRTEK